MSVSHLRVVLPFGRNGSQIEPTLLGYLAALTDSKTEFELLPVVDATPGDWQFDQRRALSGREHRIRMLSIKQAGWGHAVQHGLSEANGDIICYTHAAHTSQVDLGAALQVALFRPNNLVKVNRRIRDGIVRRIGSLLYVAERRSLFGLPYWDISGTPKVFPSALDKLLALRSTDDPIDLELSAVSRLEFYQVIEVTLCCAAADKAVSDTSLSSRLQFVRRRLPSLERDGGSRCKREVGDCVP
jgi:hypothetical protein